MTRYAILAAFLFTSCSANFHLKQAQRHLKIAEQKGAKITRDTVWSTKTVTITTPEKNANFEKPLTADTAKANKALRQRDSLQAIVSNCSKATPEQKKEAKKELAKNTKKIQDAIYKDGSYTFKPDSIVTITLTLDNGKIKVSYKQKQEVIKQDITVPVSIDQKISAGHSNWDMIILAIFCVCVGACVGWVVKSARR